MMKPIYHIAGLAVLLAQGCLNIEEEPILVIHPVAQISAHIKDQKIFATAVIEANPEIVFSGNIPTNYEFSGELAIYNTISGNVIDINTFSGGGLSQVYSVSADTLTHKRFIVIATGTIKAFADTENDRDHSNDKLISTGDFFQEAQFIVSELLAAPIQ
jgi:hypothetical protein